MRCPNCGAEQPETAKFCGECGFSLAEPTCPRCGGRVSSTDRYCGVCGADLLNLGINSTEKPSETVREPVRTTAEAAPTEAEPTQVQKKHGRKAGGKTRKRRKPVLIIAVCLLLAAGGVIGGSLIYKSMQADSGEETSYGNLLILTDTFTDRTVTDEASAILAAQDAAESLDLNNAMEELEPLDTTEAYGDTYYRLQQYYQGYPVYGRAVVVLADENGEAFTLVGNVADVDADLSFTPSVTQTELEESLSAYAEEELELSGEVSLEEASDDALVIYDLYDEETHLAYELSASLDEEMYTVVLDANDGEVLVVYEETSNVSATGTNSDGSITVNATYDESNGIYYLADTERGIYVLNLDGAKTDDVEMLKQVDDGTGGTVSIVNTDCLVSANEVNENGIAVFDDTAITYLNNVSLIYDVYQEYDMTPDSALVACYNDGFDNGSNACATSFYISVGEITGVSDIDAMAHEFAHFVMNTHIGALSSDYGSAIAEGFADIYGCLVEYELSDWEEPDWRITQDADVLFKADRDIANPQNTGNKASWDGTNYQYEVHPIEDVNYLYSTVISHSAYLMWTGNDGVGALSVDELAELWYKAMLMFPADCDFYNVRQLVLQAGSNMDLTSAQMECIKWAFNEVGIGSKWNVGNQVTIAVKDSEGNPYDDYTITITKEESFFESLLNGGAYDVTYLWDTTDLFTIELEDGTYTVTITDNANPEKEQALTLKVNESSSNQTVNIYNYGAEYTVAWGATLTILDEAGQPITDFTVSAEYENETFEIDPDSIDLEEKNYYTVTITVEDEEEVYMTIFTLRIKDSNDAADSLSIRTGVKSSKRSFYATVVDASDGTTPISGATMSIIDEGGNLIETLTSDENGAFETELIPGTYTVQIEMEGYQSVSSEVTVVAGESTDILISLPAEISDADARAAYWAFLFDEGYADDITDEDGTSYDVYMDDFQYAMYDLNGDGISELLLHSYVSGISGTYYIYGYDGDVFFIGSCDNFNREGTYYSADENALVIVSSGGADWITYEFYEVSDQLTLTYTMGHQFFGPSLGTVTEDNPLGYEIWSFYITEAGSEQRTVTEEEWNSYIDALTEIELLDLADAAISVQWDETTEYRDASGSDLSYSSDWGYYTITGCATDGTICWSVTTAEYEIIGDAVPCTIVGENDGLFYYFEYGDLIALDIEDGSQCWRIDCGLSSLDAWVFGGNGTLYAGGFCTPNFIAVSQSGAILTELTFFADTTYLPTAMQYQNGTVTVTLYPFNSSDASEMIQVTVATDDFSYEIAAANAEQQPFYGVWCAATKKNADAQSVAEQLRELGFDAQVCLTSNWEGLNSEAYYAVTAGLYATEAEANAALAEVQAAGYSSAYVKYSGDWRGNG